MSRQFSNENGLQTQHEGPTTGNRDAFPEFPEPCILKFLADGPEIYGIRLNGVAQRVPRLEFVLIAALALTSNSFVSKENLKYLLSATDQDIYRYVDRIRNLLGDKRYVEHVRCPSTRESGYKLRCVRFSIADSSGTMASELMMPGYSGLDTSFVVSGFRLDTVLGF